MHNAIRQIKKKSSHNIKLGDTEPNIQVSDTSKLLDGAIIEKTLTQQRSGLSSASIVTDGNFNVKTVSQSFFDIYNLDLLPFPVSLQEIVRARKTAGWFGLSEAFSEFDTINAVVHKLQRNQYLQDFHISPLGEVINVTHYRDSESGDFFFNYSPTAARVGLTLERSHEVRGLLALRDLIKLGMFGISPLSFEFNQPEGQTCAALICAPKSGRLIILDEAESFPELIDIHFVEDLLLSTQDISCALDKNDQYSVRVILDGSDLQLILKRQLFYAGGPSLLAGKVTKLWCGITAESILKKYPKFSLKEAEIVCLLAQGHTMKEAAAKTGKANVTASLQARSAQHKSGERSINALIARITNSQPENVQITQTDSLVTETPQTDFNSEPWLQL